MCCCDLNMYIYMYLLMQTPVGLSFCPDGGVALACSDSVSYRNRAPQRYMYIVRDCF